MKDISQTAGPAALCAVDLADMVDKTPEAILRWADRNGHGKYGRNDPLPAVVVQNYLPTGQAPLPSPPKPPPPRYNTDKPAKKKVRTWTRPGLPSRLDVINAVEIGLIFVGLWRLYELPGLCLAVMLSLFIWNAQTVAKKPELREANENGLTVVGWIAAATFVLHFITFWSAMPVISIPAHVTGEDAQRTWRVLISAAQGTAAFLPAVFVSYLSYSAVLTTYKIARKK